MSVCALVVLAMLSPIPGSCSEASIGAKGYQAGKQGTKGLMRKEVPEDFGASDSLADAGEASFADADQLEKGFAAMNTKLNRAMDFSKPDKPNDDDSASGDPFAADASDSGVTRQLKTALADLEQKDMGGAVGIAAHDHGASSLSSTMSLDSMIKALADEKQDSQKLGKKLEKQAKFDKQLKQAPDTDSDSEETLGSSEDGGGASLIEEAKPTSILEGLTAALDQGRQGLDSESSWMDSELKDIGDDPKDWKSDSKELPEMNQGGWMDDLMEKKSLGRAEPAKDKSWVDNTIERLDKAGSVQSLNINHDQAALAPEDGAFDASSE